MLGPVAAAHKPQTVSFKSRSCRILAGTALIALASCAQPNGGGVGSSASAPPERVLSVGFVDLDEIYIRQLSPADLAMRGVSSLSEIDSRVQVARNGADLTVGLAGSPSFNYPAPAEGDAAGWGRVAGEAVEALKHQSASLGATDVEKIYETMFDAIVHSLDPFSRYSSRDEARDNRASRDGFGGIGVRIDVVSDGVKVLSVMEETPAEASGLKANDVIMTIDGQDATKLDQREVIQRLRGPIGTVVALGVDRGGKQLLIKVKRAHIVPQTVSGELNGNIAVVHLSGFNHSTADMLRDKVELLDSGLPGGVQGLVLDLRGNPGGLLDQSVAVSDLFLNHGKIVTTHGRHPDSHQYFNADSDEILAGVPMIVLVDGHSASASEIVAAALQDNGRAVVVGSGSYGKGTVQTVLSLPNDGELTLTWARFHAPSGYPIHKRGIMPDICTSGAGNEDAVLRKLRRGQLPLPAALRQSVVDDANDSAVATFRANCPASEAESSLDMQIALDLLNDKQLYARASGNQAAEATP